MAKVSVLEKGYRHYREHGDEIVRRADGMFIVPGSNGKLYEPVGAAPERPECPCEARVKRCYHIISAVFKGNELDAATDKHVAAARERSKQRAAERVWFGPEQIDANVARMGG